MKQSGRVELQCRRAITIISAATAAVSGYTFTNITTGHCTALALFSSMYARLTTSATSRNPPRTNAVS